MADNDRFTKSSRFRKSPARLNGYILPIRSVNPSYIRPMFDLLSITWIILNLALALAYLRTVQGYRSAWSRLPEWQVPPHFSPSVKISVIVPARNEAAKLPVCLASIAQQSYPAALFEVLVVDDGSVDGTAALAAEFAERQANFKLVQLGTVAALPTFCRDIGLAGYQAGQHGLSNIPTGSREGGHNPVGKKAAIERGIAEASGELIVCTDADCEVPGNWLLHLAAFYQEKQAKFIAAPVNFHREANWLPRFQSLDFLGMMGVTGAGFQAKTGLLCNGANLAYPKAVFQEVNGFEGIGGLASGDDMLLLHKIAKRYPDGVFFLKNTAATVFTEAQPDLRSFLAQRLRWASKSRNYEDWQVTLRLAVAFLLSWAILLNGLLAIWFGWQLLALSLGLLLVKSVVDYRFLGEMCRYFVRMDLMRGYWLSQLGHVAYILVVGTWANFAKRYEWKGRRVR
jgi:glycosyltransferase involved in cell wall biosynthesis